MDIYISVCLGIIGSILGSFAVASTWRLRAHQLTDDKADGYKPTKAEKQELNFLKRLATSGKAQDRSHCLHCHRQLSAVDLIPVVSWLALGGRCRTCHQPIGYTEFITELGLGLALAVSYIAWPLPFGSLVGWALFFIWVLLLLCLTIHIVYDAKWLLLLDKITLIIFGLSLIFITLKLVFIDINFSASLISIAASLIILPGLYGVLYALSKGAWIGFGDVKLLIPLAIMLPNWSHALLMLFLANFIGFVVLVPGMVSGKISRTARIPFGPFLIIAWFIVMLWGNGLVQAYLGATFAL